MLGTARRSVIPTTRFPWTVVLAAITIIAIPDRATASQDDLARGRELFQERCAGCHGPSGEGGRGPTLAAAKLANTQTDEQLMWIIQYGIPGSMPESKLDEDENLAIAAWVRSLGRRPVQTARGNAEKGGRIYRGKGGCDRCHTLNGSGGAVGPDLSDIGARRGAEYLRTSLADPDADVPKIVRSGATMPENFLLVEADTHAQRIVGVRLNEDVFSIQIRDMTGRIHSLRKSEITALRKRWGRSPMPSYLSVLTNEELDDVVAFLTAQRDER